MWIKCYYCYILLGNGPNAEATAKRVHFSVHVNQTSGTQAHPEVYFHISLMHDCSFHSYLLLLHSDTLPVSIILVFMSIFSHSSLLPTFYAPLCVPSISTYLWFGCLVHFGPSPSLSLVCLSFLCSGLLIQNIPFRSSFASLFLFSPPLSWPQSSVLFFCSFP